MTTILQQYLDAAVREICQRSHVPRRRNDDHMRSYSTTPATGRADNSYDRISLEDEYGQ